MRRLAVRRLAVRTAGSRRLTGKDPHSVDCGVDSGRFSAVSALKAAGQTARIVYVFRHLAGLEAETLAA